MKSDNIFKEFKNIINENKKTYYRDYQNIKNKVNNSSAIYHGEPIDFLYQPMFYKKEDINEFKNICDKLIEIFNKVIKKYKTDAEFRSYFRFPEVMEELILADPGYNYYFPVARFDLFYNQNSIKFCEINTDGTSAMNEARVLQNIFSESQIIRNMEQEYNFDTFELFYSWIDKIIANYRQFTQNKEVKPGVAIVDFRGEGTESEFKQFKKKFIEKGYQTVICDPRELSYRNSTLYYGDFPVDLVYRRATTARMVEEADNIQDFIRAYKNKDVCVVGGFTSQVIHNKIIFAILHDRKKVSFLEDEEYEFIQQYIPETYYLNGSNQKLLTKIISNKDNYILKPCDWFACHGVYTGRDYTRNKWKQIIAESLEENYIVQEYCQVPQKEMLTISEGDMYFEKYNYIIGVFLYNEELNGIYTRAGRKNIIGTLVESFTLPNFLVSKKGDKHV